MNSRKVVMYCFQDLAVILQHHSRMKPPLQADLRGPLPLCLCRSLQDLLRCEEVAVTILERAKLAASNAFIGEVDISIYDKRDFIFTGLVPQEIC